MLPNGIAPMRGPELIEWARRADEGPFSTVAMTDRLTYRNMDPLVSLGAALGATSRVRVASMIILGPLRPAHVLAKQVATLGALGGGRFTLGIGTGGRKADYDGAGVSWARRDAILDEQLEALWRLRDADDAQTLGPKLDGVQILVGGASGASLRRLALYGDGYVSGGITPDFFAYHVQAVRGTWEEAGKPGKPRIVASTWYTMSEREGDEVDRNLADYFVQGGPPEELFGKRFRDRPLRGRTAVLEGIQRFAELGADEVVLWAPSNDLRELEWLAEIVHDLPDAA
jgi:alkanesulfonate monooxygenase SsuD/methylene tetrahydromethanopterin reductase-like flavin-dependent oxidoreductase (luciferase family)